MRNPCNVYESGYVEGKKYKEYCLYILRQSLVAHFHKGKMRIDTEGGCWWNLMESTVPFDTRDLIFKMAAFHFIFYYSRSGVYWLREQRVLTWLQAAVEVNDDHDETAQTHGKHQPDDLLLPHPDSSGVDRRAEPTAARAPAGG